MRIELRDGRERKRVESFDDVDTRLLEIESERARLFHCLTSAIRKIQWIVAVLVVAELALGVIGIQTKETSVSRRVESAEVKATLHGAQEAELASCHRLNVIRASENRSHRQDYISALAQYRFDALFLRLVTASLRQQTGSTPRTPEQARETRLFVTRLKRVSRELKATADSKEWIALTDCHRAIYQQGFTPPRPVLFVKRLPPASVYTLGAEN